MKENTFADSSRRQVNRRVKDNKFYQYQAGWRDWPIRVKGFFRFLHSAESNNKFLNITPLASCYYTRIVNSDNNNSSFKIGSIAFASNTLGKNANAATIRGP